MSTTQVQSTSAGQVVRIVQSASPAPAPGSGGSGDGGKDTFTHVQNSAATVWMISHELGRYPAVTVLDQDGNVIHADVQHLSTAVVSIGFAAAVSGRALLT